MLHEGEDRGQSAVLVAISLLVLVIFAAITVDLSSAYLGRRTAQNAADGAALAAVRQLAHQYNTGVYNDILIKRELNNFAELNGAGDSDGDPANEVNTSVTGVYLDENENAIGVVGSGLNPEGAMGVESTVFITTPAFFGGIVGQSGYPVQAQATVMLDYACGASCIVPIATHYYPFTVTAECYNIWNGATPGNFGWLNWSWQNLECSTDECSVPCLVDNLTPGTCASGFIFVGDWVGGTVKVGNSDDVRDLLEYYRVNEPFTVVVWEEVNGLTGCGKDSAGMYDPADQQGLHYRVAGFARMQVLGYQLPNGKFYPDLNEFDYNRCTTLGTDQGGFRISAKFLGWAEGEGGNCRVRYGSVRAPALKE